MQTKDNCPQGHRFEVADIFRLYGDKYRDQNRLSKEQLKVMRHIADCRTAVMGGHTMVCNECGFQQNFYNFCRDRHCPKCQTMVKEKWLNDRKAELLSSSYFHNVFTLPHDLRNEGELTSLIMHHSFRPSLPDLPDIALGTKILK